MMQQRLRPSLALLACGTDKAGGHGIWGYSDGKDRLPRLKRASIGVIP